jgi:prevent-host-death family protein
MEGLTKSEVGAYEAKTRLAELLDRVEAGGRVTITRHGRPAAQLIPIPGGAEETVDEAVKALLAFRAGHSLGPNLSVGDLIREGRKG